jgi:uncharacterized membrane protein
LRLSSAPGIALFAILALPIAAAGQNAPSFQGLGDLPGGSVGSAALAVSSDASVVVGFAEGTDGTEAVRWTHGAGLEGLGQPTASEPFSKATGVSEDGSVIVGTAVTGDGGRGFRWTTGSGHTFLGTYSCFLCDPATTADGISADGLSVVGSGLESGFVGTYQVNSSRWANGGTGIDDLGDLPGGGDAGVALDASADGSVIVGETDSTAGTSGFFWTSGGGISEVPGLPGAAYRAGGLAISDDASTIVGQANSDPGSTNVLEPVRWTGAGYTVIENLGALPGQTSSRGRAHDASPDGGLIVGTTRDLAGQDAAFLWDATSGMRSLAEVLAVEYGLDLGAWQLHEARGISEVNAFGEVTVVGVGTNPSGDSEGFVAVLSPTDCNDGLDGDGDLLIDFPEDPECTSLGDRSEGPDCSDGLDNDGDGLADFGADPDCTDGADLSELPDCADAFDDDGDGLVDYPADPGCRTAASQTEEPECDDGIDNDDDLAVDAADADCLVPSDTSERVDCSDGVDNDGDGFFDFPADPDCEGADDPSEDPACFDFVDNDGDGRVDFPLAHPRCRDPSDPTEAPECSGGADDDGDGLIDFPADPGCGGPLFDVESPAAVTAGDLLVTDRGASILYALDPSTGAEQVVSQGASLAAPEGLAVGGNGRVVVSSLAGVLEVRLPTGSQDFRSGAFSSVGGLPVAADSAGDLVVLDTAGIHRVTWNPSGVGATTTLAATPIGGDPGQLHLFNGFTLVLEDDDNALTTGFGLLGDGVFRIDLVTGTVSKVTPSFQGHTWRDLVMETPGTLLAVGLHGTLGEAVCRIDVATGDVTALSTDPAWQQLDGVAVTSAGDIYVADSGLCDEGGCSGGLVAHVDPVSGARSDVRSGIFAGTLQIAVADPLAAACDDGVDNDGDGLVDSSDAGCSEASDGDEHDPALLCDNGLDDDSDGLPDYPLDPGCRNATWALEDPACDNDEDDDGDGGIDWDGGSGGAEPDPQCSNRGWKQKETASSSGCGLGCELLFLLPLLAGVLGRRR